MEPAIAVLDIETSPSLGAVWGLWRNNIGLNQLYADWRIICYGWKWTTAKGVTVRSADQTGCDIDNDRVLLDDIWHLMDKADIVIGHNVRGFDKKKINARLIESGFPPYSPVRYIDTLVEARRIAAFTSNKLDHLSRILTEIPKSRHEKYPGFDLWAATVWRNDPKAWAAMRRYQRRDVLAGEAVYNVLKPWMENHPNLRAYDEDGEAACPRCNSHDVIRQGYRTTQAGRYPRYQCKSCGGWSAGRYLDRSYSRTNLLRPS